VDVKRLSDATLELAVRDDGGGFDAAAGEDNTGLGRSLIEAFVRQLRGELEISGDAGTSLVVRFPAAARHPGEGTAPAPGVAVASPVGRESQAVAAPLPKAESG
jgi:signal transduction histidine kinase